MATDLTNLTGTAVNGQTKLRVPTVNADSNAWGTILNNNWNLVDQVFKDDGTGDGVGLKIGSSQTLDATSGTTKVNTPSNASDATTKSYVDGKVPLTVPANQALIGPTSGSDAAPSFRVLAADDIPSLAGEKITSGTVAAARVATLNQDTTGTSAGLSVTDTTDNPSTTQTLAYDSTNDKFVFSRKAEAPDFCATSDRELKQDIRPLENALDLIREVKVHRFEWKGTGVPGIGVIAQELREVLPEAVDEGDPMSVHYNYLFAVLVQAVQELDMSMGIVEDEIETLQK